MELSAPNALVFLAYMVVDVILTLVICQRIIKGWKIGDRKEWTISRALILIGVFGTALDNLRIFLGGFAWENGEVPKYAGLIYVLIFMHLGIVPFITFAPVELAIASNGARPGEDSRKSKIVRIVCLVISTILAAIGVMNALAEIQVTANDTGYQHEVEFGVNLYRASNVTVAKEFGYVGIEGMSLTGVVWFSFACVFAGGYVWYRTSYKLFFFLSVIALAGQALGPLNKGYFFYSSNLMEIVSFSSLILAERVLFKPMSNVKGNSDIQPASSLAY